MSTTNDTPSEYGDRRPTNENGADGPGCGAKIIKG